MKYHEPLKQILTERRGHWDHDGTAPNIRHAFLKALQCRTLELGANVFGLEGQELIVCHTCKSPACPSCGHRGNIQWLRERWAALPDVPYKGITFTMPGVLWQFFRDNRSLTRALPSFATTIVKMQAYARHGAHPGITAILHTFNGKLEFNSHVHTMVTAGGLHESKASWIPGVFYRHDELVKSWRKAVIKILRTALRAGQLRTKLSVEEVESILDTEEKVWWQIKIQSFHSKIAFLKYAGRYVRRPPIAQRRITYIGDGLVKFWYRDKIFLRRVEEQCSMEEFIDRWAQHIGQRYQHSVRGFGLFAPRSLSQSSATIFALLGQRQRSRPKPRLWADSVKRDFGRDPLLHHSGKRMILLRRLNPKQSI